MGVFLGGGVSKVSTVDLVDWTSPGLVTMARPFCRKLSCCYEKETNRNRVDKMKMFFMRLYHYCKDLVVATIQLI